MISKEQIQQVKDQTDIVQLIGSYIDLKKAGSGHKGLCPFHNEKSPSFNVSAQNQFFHCFGCGESGSAFDFLMKIEGIQFMDALNQLADQAGITLINDSTPQQRQKMAIIKEGKERIKDLMKQASNWYMQQLHTSGAEIARQYLNQRHIDSEAIRHFGLGYSPDKWDGIKNWAKTHGFSNQDLVDAGLLIVPEGKNIEQGYDRFRGRLMFPIWDDAGNVVGFSARTLKDENAKYINSPETAIFNKSKVLYAFPYAKAGFRQHKYAIICEGQLDVIACHRAGFTNAVAPQGTAFTDEQAKLLHRFVSHVAVAFDSDNAGRKAADRSFESLLGAGIEMSVIAMPDGEDPDGIFQKQGKAGLEHYFSNRQDYFDFKIENFNNTTFNDAGEKAAFAQEIIEKAALIKDPITRSFIIQKFSSLNIPEQAIRETLNSIQNKNRQQTRRQPEHPAFNSNLGQKPYQSNTLTKEQKAKINLIDLAVNHGFIAHQLIHQLDHIVFKTDIYGHLLGEIIGLTIQGEWKNVAKLLFEHHHENLPPMVMTVLMSSEFSHLNVEDVENRRQIEKIAEDCVFTLQESSLNEQKCKMEELFKHETDSNKRRDIYTEITTIRSRLEQIRKSKKRISKA